MPITHLPLFDVISILKKLRDLPNIIIIKFSASKGEAHLSFGTVVQEIWGFGRGVLVTHLPIHIQNSGSLQVSSLYFNMYNVKRNQIL